MGKNLDILRREIDEINSQMLELLNKRTQVIAQIGEIKDEDNGGLFSPVREQQMLKDIHEQNQGPITNEMIDSIYKEIFRQSLKFMKIKKKKDLLINKDSKKKFHTIKEMFNLDNNKVIIAGPCSIERYDYLEEVAKVLNEEGIRFIRGGAYKPRTSPYDFQGLRYDGLKILKDIGQKYNLFTVTEVIDTRDVELVSQFTDVLQIGARNMQNFELLKEVGKTKKPVLLKRGMSASIRELKYAAEYIALQGNDKIILCERGIRTFETETRNTLDISSIPIIKKDTHLPIIVDVSHSLGRKDITGLISKASLAAGADGLMIEVHPNPQLALSDNEQQLNLNEFRSLLKDLN